MAKIVTMGELLMRLSSPGNKRLLQSDRFDVNYGGGEANVAVSLQNYGDDAFFVSKIPTHEIGQAALNSLRTFGVHTDHIARGGERLGIYFLETGSSLRPSKVLYDRAHSSFCEATPDDFDFDAIFRDADWFHWSGITPALGKGTAECVEQACIAAKKAGVTISCDLNFRGKLWTTEEARAVMCPLMKYVDVCIGNEEDAEKCLGFRPTADVKNGKTDADGYKDIFERMAARFGFKYVVGTLRESFSASHNGWKALIYDGKEFCVSRRYELNPIVDRVGAGDSFSAGIIHGLANGKPTKWTLEFAAAASALKHTIPGDVNLVLKGEVEALMNGNGNGRVER